jgi:hypothetical protein
MFWNRTIKIYELQSREFCDCGSFFFADINEAAKNWRDILSNDKNAKIYEIILPKMDKQLAVNLLNKTDFKHNIKIILPLPRIPIGKANIASTGL